MYKSISLTNEEIDELLHIAAYGNSNDIISSVADWNWTSDDWNDEEPPRVPVSWCVHEWVGVLLINTTKYHCKKCGIHKEDL